MAMETTNPTSVGAPTKKSHYDKVFENTTWIWSILDKYLTPSAKSTLLDNRLLPGYVNRPEFSRASTNSVKMTAGAYELFDGTTSRMVAWNADLTYTFTNLTTVSTWCYLYLDESAISTNILTTSEFTDSTVAPSYDSTQGGYYNGNDRCILAVRSNTAGEMDEFYHDGNEVIQYVSHFIDITKTATFFDWTTAQITIPPVSKKALVSWAVIHKSTAYQTIRYRPAGSTSTVGHIVNQIYSTITDNDNNCHNTISVLTDSSQEIEYGCGVQSTLSNITLTVYTHGYYFPKGM